VRSPQTPIKTGSDREPREEGYYWVEIDGDMEILYFRPRGTAEGGPGKPEWRRTGTAEPLDESELEFVYPGRLAPPIVRMDYSVEDEFDRGESESEAIVDCDRSNPACYDCGLSFPFDLDMHLPDEQWKALFPEFGGRGWLCPPCMCKRAAQLPNVDLIRARLELIHPHRVADRPSVLPEKGP